MNAPVLVHEPAQIRDWLPERYYAETEYVSRSELYRLADSVAVFLHGEEPKERFRGESLTTKPAATGQLVHLGVLEFGMYQVKVIPWSKTAKASPAPGEAPEEHRFDEGPLRVELPFASDDVDPPPDYLAMLTTRSEASVEADLAEVAPALKKKRGKKTDAEKAADAAAAAAKKAAKEREAALKAEHAQAKNDLIALADEWDLWLVPPDDLARADAIIDSIWRNPKAATYLRGEAIVGGHACIAVYSEVAITWTDEATGVKCRALLDRLLVYPHCVVIIDLKTDRGTPSPQRWAYRAIKEWLYEQAEFYSRGAAKVWGKPALFLWVVARNNPPWIAGVHKPRRDELALAEKTNNALLRRLAVLMEADAWMDEWTNKVIVAEPTNGGTRILESRADAAARLVSTAS